MSYEDDVDDFLNAGASVPSASFLTKGTKHAGVICERPTVRQQTDLDTGEPKFWKNGDKMMMAVVTIQTDERDPEIEDDDGRRRFYISFKMREAVAEALKEASEKAGEKLKLEEGGWLEIEFTSQEKPKRKGHSGIKHYEAYYEPPEDSYFDADNDDPDEDDEPEPPARGRGRGRTAAKAAPAKAAPRGRGRRQAEPEPEEDDAEPEPPARGRGRAAAKAAPAKAAARGRGRRQAEPDEYEEGEEAF